jgi:hypothetical protein
MNNNDEDANPMQGNRGSLLRASIGGVAFVLLILLMMILGNRLRTISDELDHCAPETTYGIDISESQTVYVPIYTHVETVDGKQPLDFTLAIRNSDPDHAIVITSTRFYDGKGKLVKSYHDGSSIELAPLEARTVVVKHSSIRDIGPAANFIVNWKSTVPVYEPVIDAVMFGFVDGKSMTFNSVGRPLAQRTD